MAGALLTLREAYPLCGLSDFALRARIREGVLPAVRGVRGIWLVHADDVALLTRRRRDWTPADDDQLLALLSRMSVATIARRLGRTKAAVEQRIYTIGATISSGGGDLLTAADVARELGVASRTVVGWVHAGEIATRQFRPVVGPFRCYLIDQRAVEAFIRARVLGPPRKEPCWHWRRMPPGYFRNYAERLIAGKG